MSDYRTQGEVIPDGPDPLKRGPSANCPGCNASALVLTQSVGIVGTTAKTADAHLGYTKDSPLPAPRACTPRARVRIGWFRRCREPGEHLHERCKVCKFRWLTAFAEST